MENLFEYSKSIFEKVSNPEKYVKVEIKKGKADNGLRVKEGVGIFTTLENGKMFHRFVSTKKEAYQYSKELENIINKFERSDVYLVERVLDDLLVNPEISVLKIDTKSDGLKNLIKRFIRANLPYCIQIHKDSSYAIRTILLNRDYKPLGVFGYNDWVCYKPYIDNRGMCGEHLIEFYSPYCDCENFSYFEADERTEKHYFYTDANAPYYGEKEFLNYVFYLKLYLTSIRVKQGFLTKEEANKLCRYYLREAFEKFNRRNIFYKFYEEKISEYFLRRFDGAKSRA